MAISPDAQVSAHEDGLAILHIRTGRVFVCNRTGTRIWQGLAKGLTSDAVSEEISREYGLARDVARRDTQSFVAELERQGLVTRAAR